MNYRKTAEDFFWKYQQHPDFIDVEKQTEYIVRHMKDGLAGKPSDLMMIPTYLSTEGIVEGKETAIVIDAGGTNFRIATVTFDNGEIEIGHFTKRKMFGVGTPIEKEQFIDELAKLICPLLKYSDKVGFCFSYAAEITPEKDGRVISMSKEVYINGIQGTLLGKEITARLKDMGVEKEVHFVLLNDTVSTLLEIGRASCRERV